MIPPVSPAYVQWIALSLIPALGSRTLARLLTHFGSLEAIFHADENELRAVPRIGPKLAAAIRAIDLDHTQAAITAWRADGIMLLTHGTLHEQARFATSPDGLFPVVLQSLIDAPPLLFLHGTFYPADARAVAIVGTRRPTAAARQWAATLAGTLAVRGWTVVSGLAEGIDTAAHEGSLRVGGRTLAVLGCGVRVIFPPTNTVLAARIVEHGALLSETHPDASPHSPTLVARNRLISGLSCAVIVVEAGESSGSLHAARFARKQNRLVYAVQNHAAGNHHLITTGARPLAPDFAAWDQLSDELAGGIQTPARE